MPDDSTLTPRQLQILEWLGEERRLTIQQMAQRFNVSGMTIHRDLDSLQADGRLRKVRGGATLAPAAEGDSWPTCAMCGKRVPRRTSWLGAAADGERWQACCSHCGLLQMRQMPGAQLVLAADFLYGQMVNVFQATFVLGSEISLCCVPSVLCFASVQDAERFQRGFGGAILDFAGAMRAICEAHHHDAGGTEA